MPAKITVEMRDEILNQVKAGRTKEEMLTIGQGFMVQNFIRLQIWFRLAWVFPIIGLLAGVIIVSVAVKGRCAVAKKPKT